MTDLRTLMNNSEKIVLMIIDAINCKNNARWNQSDDKNLNSSWRFQDKLYSLFNDYK